MRFPWVNILLLLLLSLQAVTGYFGLTNGEEPSAWILWLHGIGAYALLLLMFLKASIILDAWRRRRRWTGTRLAFIFLIILLLITLLTGLLWTMNGPIYIGGFSLVSIHMYVAIILMGLMFWHAWQLRFIRRVPGASGRRLFLGSSVFAISGMILWWFTERIKALAGFEGANRRFTGSYEAGSFSLTFPVVSWIGDRPPPVNLKSWTLRIEGAVKNSMVLDYEGLSQMPHQTITTVLDCTGGWYTIQHWRGVMVRTLFEQTGLLSEASSVTFESLTGYKRRFKLAEAQDFMLALGITTDSMGDDFDSLSSGHGFPIRLVAPGKRGMEWVKWVSLIRINESAAWQQLPLPLQ
jgi:hypothetical protein